MNQVCSYWPTLSRVTVPVFSVVWLSLMVCVTAEVQAQTERDTRSEARAFVNVEDNESPSQTIANCRKFLQTYPESDFRGEVVRLLGSQQRKLKQYDEAIQTCESYLREKPTEGWRQVRADVEAELARCFVEQGRFQAAFKAFQAAEEHEVGGDCVTCYLGDVARHRLWQGYCLEHLGRFDQAAERYWNCVRTQSFGETLGWRLVELYLAAGRRDNLVKIMDELDVDAVRRAEKQGLRQADLDEYPATKSMRDLVGLHDAARKADWSTLVKALLEDDAPSSPLEGESRLVRGKAMTAVRLVAKYREQSVPFILQELRRHGVLRATRPKNNDRFGAQPGDDPFAAPAQADRLPAVDKEAVTSYGGAYWVWYALGRCGTPAALDALESELRGETNFHRCEILTFSLTAAGPAGLRRLKNLAATRVDRKGEFEAALQGQLGEPDVMTFPTPHVGIDLPSNISN